MLYFAGRLGTMFQFFIVIGILYSYTFGVFTTYVSFGLFSAIWSLLHFFGILCIPESPYFLMSNNEPDRAAASLQALRDSKNITEELSTIKVRLRNQSTHYQFTILTFKISKGKICLLICSRAIKNTNFQVILLMF